MHQGKASSCLSRGRLQISINHSCFSVNPHEPHLHKGLTSNFCTDITPRAPLYCTLLRRGGSGSHGELLHRASEAALDH